MMALSYTCAHLYTYSVQFQPKCTQHTNQYENDESVAEKTIMDLINLFGTLMQVNGASQGQGSTQVYYGFGVFLNRSFYGPLFCDQNKPLVMPNGQVLTKLWSK